MKIVIQKYGGTSLKNLNAKSKILTHIKKCINEGNSLVIVVSAIGRKGDPYATDTLIEQLEQINSNINPKKKDLIMSCGETISTAIFAHLLDKENIPSEPLIGFQAGILTNNSFNCAEIINIDTSTIMKNIKKGKVVVVAGFQGITKDNEITTLGRGGSDTTAVALGGYLGAERVDIFTDVAGVGIIDPTMVPYTKYIKNITYSHMYNLASNGVKVIHPKAVLIGQKFNIPIRITSVESDITGTLVSNTTQIEKVIGIAIKQENENKIFSIFTNEKHTKNVLKDLDGFLSDNKKNILDIQLSNGKISIVVGTDKTSHLAQCLYNHLFD